MTKKKKSTNRNAKNLSEAVGFSNIFHHEKIDFLLGLILFAFAIYVVIAIYIAIFIASPYLPASHCDAAAPSQSQ